VLAKCGGIYVLPDDFEKLPLCFRLGWLPISSGMPLWEKPSAPGRIPRQRTDGGVWLTAEALGNERVIFVKDEDHLFTNAPKKMPDATHIPRISAQEFIERDLPHVVMERVVLEYVTRAQRCKELLIINDLKPGMLTGALAGEPVGSITYQG
jgi:uridylate kinase